MQLVFPNESWQILVIHGSLVMTRIHITRPYSQSTSHHITSHHITVARRKYLLGRRRGIIILYVQTSVPTRSAALQRPPAPPCTKQLLDISLGGTRRSVLLLLATISNAQNIAHKQHTDDTDQPFRHSDFSFIYFLRSSALQPQKISIHSLSLSLSLSYLIFIQELKNKKRRNDSLLSRLVLFCHSKFVSSSCYLQKYSISIQENNDDEG